MKVRELISLLESFPAGMEVQVAGEAGHSCCIVDKLADPSENVLTLHISVDGSPEGEVRIMRTSEQPPPRDVFVIEGRHPGQKLWFNLYDHYYLSRRRADEGKEMGQPKTLEVRVNKLVHCE